MKERRSRSHRAGLVFPVSRLESRHRRSLHHLRLSSLSPVFLAAVLEYLTAELLELAGDVAQRNKRKRITPRHLLITIAMDEELSKTLSKVTLPGAGIFPKKIPVAPSKGPKKAPSSPAPTKVVKKSAKASKKVSPKTSKKAAPAKKSPAPKVSRKTKPKTIKSTTTKSTTPQVPQPTPKIPSDVKVLSEKTLFLGWKLTVIQGDILKVPVDAIINPTNNNYYLGGLVGKALKAAGGPEFEVEVDKLRREKGMLPMAGAVLCPAHHIAAKWVVHCCGPQFRQTDSQQLLTKTITACLAVADSANLRTLALPSVGSGSAGFPKKMAAKIILRSIEDYFASVMTTSLVQIYFVLYDPESVKVYSEIISGMNGQASDSAASAQ